MSPIWIGSNIPLLVFDPWPPASRIKYRSNNVTTLFIIHILSANIRESASRAEAKENSFSRGKNPSSASVMASPPYLPNFFVSISIALLILIRRQRTFFHPYYRLSVCTIKFKRLILALSSDCQGWKTFALPYPKPSFKEVELFWNSSASPDYPQRGGWTPLGHSGHRLGIFRIFTRAVENQSR